MPGPVSIVNVVIIVLLGATLCPVMTSITLIGLESKAMVRQIDDGEGKLSMSSGGQAKAILR